MRKQPDERLVEMCAGCKKADRKKNRCRAFVEPVYQWREGKCFGRSGGEVIYLAGSIDARNYADATEWRMRAQEVLEKAGYVVLNPCRGKTEKETNSKWIVESCLTDVRRSDTLLVDMSTDTQCIGTAMEIRYAWERKKQIVVWGDACAGSHFLRYHATRRHKTLTDALKELTCKAYKEDAR